MNCFILFVVCFILKLICRRHKNLHQYVYQKYGTQFKITLKSYEKKLLQKNKAQLDLQFLLHCRTNHLYPNFIKFKLYKKHLYRSDFYTESLLKLLEGEIKFKEKTISKLSQCLYGLGGDIVTTVTFLDSILVKAFFRNLSSDQIERVQTVHSNKLSKLGIILPPTRSNNNFIFNFSSRKLTNKEQFLLSFGLDYSLPLSTNKHVEFFTLWEKLAYSLKSWCDCSTFKKLIPDLSHISHRQFNYSKKNHFWQPYFFKCDHLFLFYTVTSRNTLVDRVLYEEMFFKNLIRKMEKILH